MKKNISINISGIIFHIEEDGYANLKNYLESINKYFSSYEDSAEIIADIESRIAEIFLLKLDDSKQIIVIDDVAALIDTMGTIADFEAIEDDEPLGQKEESATEETKNEERADRENEESKGSADERKRFYRDEKRKVIGGVAAGLAYFLRVDPLWVRLIFVVLFFNLFFGAFSGMVMLAYIILWIVTPPSTTLVEDEKMKKMFRDSENQVLGGVAGGIASYFGIDVTVIRLLFVLSIFLGGSGFFLYIILWMVTPLAKTITEKMQMQGEPVTLSNIQQSVSNSLKNEKGEESPLAKILLFPFRILAEVFKALSKILGPLSKVLVEVIRVFAGAVIALAGLVTMICLFLATGIMLGTFTGLHEYFLIGDVPIIAIANGFSSWLYICVFFAAFAPVFLFTLLGISILIKQMVIRASLGWIIFSVWIMSIVGLAFLGPKAYYSFSEESEYKESRTFSFEQDPVVLRVEYLDDSFDMARLRLRGYEDSVFRLDINTFARGSSKSDALDNAQMVTYGVEHGKNELIFDSHFKFKEKGKFRAQKVSSTLYIPYNDVFKLDASMKGLLTNTLHRSKYGHWYLDEDHSWTMTTQGLKCMTCGEEEDTGRNTNEDVEYIEEDSSREERRTSEYRRKQIEYYGRGESSGSMEFEMEDFDEVEVSGLYNVHIEESDDYSVSITGPDDLTADVVVKKYSSVLEINNRSNHRNWRNLKNLHDDRQVDVYISMPKLEKVKISGLSHVDAEGFDSDDLVIDLSGGSSCRMNVTSNDINIRLDGGSWLDLGGKSEYITARISGASSLRAYDMKSDILEVRATGVSKARVSAKEKLIVDATGLSHVTYKGNPKLEISNEGGLSTIRRSDY